MLRGPYGPEVALCVGLKPTPASFLGRQRAPAPSFDDAGHPLDGFDREHGAHLSVARLAAPQARDRPELGEQAGPIAVDRELCAIEPFDVPIAAGDDGESFSVGLDPEPMRLGKSAELLDGALVFGRLSPT